MEGFLELYKSPFWVERRLNKLKINFKNGEKRQFLTIDFKQLSFAIWSKVTSETSGLPR